jgi:hypothetical protein
MVAAVKGEDMRAGGPRTQGFPLLSAIALVRLPACPTRALKKVDFAKALSSY